jgi:methyl-accepting chemotaxis protein
MFNDFQQMADTLRDLLNNAKNTALNVRVASEGIVEDSEQASEKVESLVQVLQSLAADSDNQVASLKESSVAMDSIAMGIQDIAEATSSVSTMAQGTVTQANEGSAVINKSVEQMETINHVVEDTAGVVDRLVERTKTIDEALKSITAIAEQTNLLALNASIEAARAGEQGRGFAVVADEVSKLAAQSKDSANEINALLIEIQKDTLEASRSMEQGKRETYQGMEAIRQAGEAFNGIVEQVTAMSEQVQEVSSTVEEMFAGTEEMNTSLSDVVYSSEEMSRKTLEVATEGTKGSETIGGLVTVAGESKSNVLELESMLEKFKTE